MIINTKHPDRERFIENELNTLNYLKNNSNIQELFSNLAGKADVSYHLMKKATSDFSFECDFSIEIEKKSHTVVVGFIIDKKYELVSYYLVVCSLDSKEAIRKFHFDYAVPKTPVRVKGVVKSEDKKPVYHLQYGGKLSPFLRDTLKLESEKLSTWLSSPRLYYSPITLALILDIVFCEFQSVSTNRITASSEWRDLIIKNERFLVEPFYQGINKFMESRRYNKTCLLRDFYYGG